MGVQFFLRKNKKKFIKNLQKRTKRNCKSKKIFLYLIKESFEKVCFSYPMKEITANRN